jgi:hypothetical protein
MNEEISGTHTLEVVVGGAEGVDELVFCIAGVEVDFVADGEKPGRLLDLLILVVKLLDEEGGAVDVEAEVV